MLRDRTSTQMLIAGIAAIVIGLGMIGYGIVTAMDSPSPSPSTHVQSLVDDDDGRGVSGTF